VDIAAAAGIAPLETVTPSETNENDMWPEGWAVPGAGWIRAHPVRTIPGALVVSTVTDERGGIA
jgi:hypothetical protein